MTEVKIVQFNPRHLEVMEIRDEEMLGSMQLEDAYGRMDRVAKGSLAAATFMYDGRIVFCAGFHQIWPGVLEVWMIPSVHAAKKLPISFPRIIRRYVENIERDFKAHRIQTTSYHDPFHARWMEWLGFKNETPNGMINFTHHKKTMCIYARTT